MVGDAGRLRGLRPEVLPVANVEADKMVQQKVPRGVEIPKKKRRAGLGKCPSIMQVLRGSPACPAMAAAGATKGVLLKQVPRGVATETVHRSTDWIVRSVRSGCRCGQVVLLRRLPMAQQEGRNRELSQVR